MQWIIKSLVNDASYMTYNFDRRHVGDGCRVCQSILDILDLSNRSGIKFSDLQELRKLLEADTSQTCKYCVEREFQDGLIDFQNCFDTHEFQLNLAQEQYIEFSRLMKVQADQQAKQHLELTRWLQQGMSAQTDAAPAASSSEFKQGVERLQAEVKQLRADLEKSRSEVKDANARIAILQDENVQKDSIIKSQDTDLGDCQKQILLLLAEHKQQAHQFANTMVQYQQAHETWQRDERVYRLEHALNEELQSDIDLTMSKLEAATIKLQGCQTITYQLHNAAVELIEAVRARDVDNELGSLVSNLEHWMSDLQDKLAVQDGDSDTANDDGSDRDDEFYECGTGKVESTGNNGDGAVVDSNSNVSGAATAGAIVGNNGA